MSNLAAYRLESGDSSEAELSIAAALRVAKNPRADASRDALDNGQPWRALSIKKSADGCGEYRAHLTRITRKALGAEHPDTFDSMATLANVLRDKGDFPAAKGLYERSLEGLRRSPGSTHPTTLKVLYEYSLMLKNQRHFPRSPTRLRTRRGSPRLTPKKPRRSHQIRTPPRFAKVTHSRHYGQGGQSEPAKASRSGANAARESRSSRAIREVDPLLTRHGATRR